MGALERLAQNRNLYRDLLLIPRVLVLATAADAEVGARRHRAPATRLEHRGKRGLGEALLLQRRLRFHQLARQRVGNDDDPALRTREAGTAVHHLLDTQLHAWLM